VDLDGARIVVAGATGVFGGTLARELAAGGAEVGVMGRNAERLDAVAEELDAPSARFDAADPGSCRHGVDALAAALGGLDVFAVTAGVAAFGAAGELDTETIEAVFAANVTGPIALIDEALGHLEDDGAVVALSAIVADYPTAGVAAYSASKAALSAYVTALRRERRKQGLTVLDVRPPHMDTDFADRALTGSPPPLPAPLDHHDVVAAVIDALRDGRREVAWDLQSKALVARG